MGGIGQSSQESIYLLRGRSGTTPGDQVIEDTLDRDHTDNLPWSLNMICQTNNGLFGYLLGFLAVALITTSLACAQALEKSIPHSELNGLRFSFQLAIVCPILIGYNRCDVRVNTKLICWVALCAVLLTIASYGSYGAVYYLPLGVSSGIISSIILIINFIVTIIRYKSITWYDSVSVIGCVLGLIMITQPYHIFHNDNLSPIIAANISNSSCHATSTRVKTNWTSQWSSYHEETDTTDKHMEEITGSMLCILSGVALATYMQIVNRKLTDVSIFIFNFWVSLFGVASSFCIMAATEDPYIPSLPKCITWFLLHSITSGLINMVTYKMYQIVDPIVAALILTLQIPATFILQYTLFADIHPGHVDAVGISGSMLVILGNAFVPLYKLIETCCAKWNTHSDINIEQSSLSKLNLSTYCSKMVDSCYRNNRAQSDHK